ncbi:MAG: 2-C-methyl-D-erythritol 4-phosphate cytidylyltransferase [Gammaproteobacteria bacterium WSBS_2016_MAG_OTU1]
MTCWAIIVAAGGGTRAGKEPKQFSAINGRAVLWHTIQPFIRAPFIDKIRIVVAADSLSVAQKSVGECLPLVEIVATGGETRAESVLGGLQELAENDWAMIHDGARPCLRDEVLARFWQQTSQDKVGGLLVIPLGDTLKNSDNERVQKTISRDNKFLAQTPQMFRVGALRTALQKSLATADSIADDSESMEAAGYLPLLVQGETANIKITYPEDFTMAAALLRHKRTAVEQ